MSACTFDLDSPACQECVCYGDCLDSECGYPDLHIEERTDAPMKVLRANGSPAGRARSKRRLAYV